MASVKTNPRIPPPPSRPPPTLPDTQVLTTYTRTRSVSPAPFIISHDTFIKTNNVKTNVKEDTLVKSDADVKKKEAIKNAAPDNCDDKNNKQNKLAKIVHKNGSSSKKLAGEASCLQISKNLFEQPVISIEPATPPPAAGLSDENMKLSEKFESDHPMHRQPSDICETAQKFTSSSKSVDKNLGQSDLEEDLKGHEAECRTIQRRGSRKKKLKSNKSDDESKNTPEKSNFGDGSTKSVPINDSPGHDTTKNILDNLTEKEITVITQVLNSRQTRSRPASREDMVTEPELMGNRSPGVVRPPVKNCVQLGEEEGLIFTSPDAQYCTGAGGLSENISDNGVTVSDEDLNISETTSVLSKISEQTHLNQENISAPSPSPPLRYKKALKEENMKSRQEIIDKPSVKSLNKSKECSVTTSSTPTDMCEDFDPYDIVEHIADLTVEQLKESLLGGQEQQSKDIQENSKDNLKLQLNKIAEDDTETNNNSIIPGEPCYQNNVKKIIVQEEARVVTPPSRTKRKEKIFDKIINGKPEEIVTANSILQEETSSASHESSLTSSRSETPRKKRCRLRVVKKEEEARDDAKVKKGIIEISTKTNEDVTLKMEEGKLSRKIEPESNQSKLSVTETKISNGKSTINDENTGHKVETKLSSKDKCFMNELDERPNAAVNIPITPIKNTEVLPQNDLNNGQLCRQTQDTQKKGKLIVSCLAVLVVAVICYLVFNVVDVAKQELHTGAKDHRQQQDYEYFKIKQWP